MAWEDDLFSLFDDLEQQAEALYDRERELELADRSRSEYAAVTLVSRLMASLEADVELDVEGVGRVSGTLQRVGPDWCLVHGAGQDWMLPLEAVARIVGVSERSVPEVAWSPVARLGLGSALRRLADAGERCLLHLRDGSAHEGVPVRVGADFVEVRGSGDRVFLVAFAGLAAVQRRED